MVYSNIKNKLLAHKFYRQITEKNIDKKNFINIFIFLLTNNYLSQKNLNEHYLYENNYVTHICYMIKRSLLCKYIIISYKDVKIFLDKNKPTVSYNYKKPKAKTFQTLDEATIYFFKKLKERHPKPHSF